MSSIVKWRHITIFTRGRRPRHGCLSKVLFVFLFAVMLAYSDPRRIRHGLICYFLSKDIDGGTDRRCLSRHVVINTAGYNLAATLTHSRFSPSSGPHRTARWRGKCKGVRDTYALQTRTKRFRGACSRKVYVRDSCCLQALQADVDIMMEVVYQCGLIWAAFGSIEITHADELFSNWLLHSYSGTVAHPKRPEETGRLPSWQPFFVGLTPRSGRPRICPRGTRRCCRVYVFTVFKIRKRAERRVRHHGQLLNS